MGQADNEATVSGGSIDNSIGQFPQIRGVVGKAIDSLPASIIFDLIQICNNKFSSRSLGERKRKGLVYGYK